MIDGLARDPRQVSVKIVVQNELRVIDSGYKYPPAPFKEYDFLMTTRIISPVLYGSLSSLRGEVVRGRPGAASSRPSAPAGRGRVMGQGEGKVLRIGLDIRMRGRSGIGEYVSQLVSRLPKFLPGGQLVLFGVRGRAKVTGNVVPVRSPIYSMAEQVSLPLAAAGKGLSVFHAPHYNAPLAMSTPLVVTIHDLIHLLFPEYLPAPRWFSRAYAWMQIRAACARAKMVLTPSEHTRSDLVRHLKIHPSKIRVTPLGVDESLAPIRDTARLSAFRRRRGLGKSYILFVGNLRPHKNLERLIRAFGALADRTVKLVLVGQEDVRYEAARRLIKDLQLRGRVVLTGRVSSADLRWYYSAARLLVLPSLYEGFGLSPLEAMTCGVPVVASRAASIPEVTGNAAVLVDPFSERELFQALRAVQADQELRRQLIARGYSRVRQFSWDRMAGLTADAYGWVAERAARFVGRPAGFPGHQRPI